jgi:hypothetical protein
MHHTFLLEEGGWHAAGYLLDEAGEHVSVSGRSSIRHGDEEWWNESELTLQSGPAQRIEHRYRFTPFVRGRMDTGWTAEHSELGTFSGRLVIVGDALLSKGQSPDGRNTVIECLLQRSEGCYLSRGAWFRDGAHISSWIIELTRD